MRVYLDTNIIFDFLLDSRGEFHAPAVELMRAVASRDLSAGFSSSQATDIYYSLCKVAGDAAAREALSVLFILCDVFPTPEQACVNALSSPMADYEDAVQAQTAKAYGCDYLVTRNLSDYTEAEVPALDAREMLSLIR